MSLETCDDGHDQIVYEAAGSRSKCPVCQLMQDHIKEIEERDRSIENLEAEIGEFEKDSAKLEDRVAELEEQLPEQGPIVDPRCKRVVPDIKKKENKI